MSFRKCLQAAEKQTAACMQPACQCLNHTALRDLNQFKKLFFKNIKSIENFRI